MKFLSNLLKLALVAALLPVTASADVPAPMVAHTTASWNALSSAQKDFLYLKSGAESGLHSWPCAATQSSKKTGKLIDGKCQTISNGNIYYNTSFWVVIGGLDPDSVWVDPVYRDDPFPREMLASGAGGNLQYWCRAFKVPGDYSEVRIGKYDRSTNVCQWNHGSNIYFSDNGWPPTYFEILVNDY